MQRAAKLTFLSAGILMVAAALVTANRAHAANPTVQVAIDVNTSGNGDNALGTTEACNATPLQVGDTFDIDIVVRDVPNYVPPASGQLSGSNGIAGFGFNLLFDPAVLQVNKVQSYDGPTILKTTGDTMPIVYLDYDGLHFPGREAAPGTTGNVRIDILDLSLNYESGDGVLTRVTLKAVGDGVSRLDLTDAFERSTMPTIYAPGVQYDATTSSATVAVGNGSCAGQTPGPFPFPTTLPGPSPTVTGHYTLTLEPATIPLNEDSVVTVKAFADSPGIAYLSIDIDLHNVQVVSCTSDVICRHEGAIPLEFFDGTGHARVGDFTVGQVTVHPSGPAGTALEFESIGINNPDGADLTGSLTIINGKVTAIGGPPTPTSTPGATPSQTSTPATSAPTPTVTPASLPHGGGPPVAGSASWPIAALLAGTVALGAAFVLAWRTTRH